MGSPVLGLSSASFASVVPGGYSERLELDGVISGNAARVDSFAGGLTGSLENSIFISGTMDSKAGQVIGIMYARVPLVIKEVVAVAANSGAGGVTSIDVQKQDTVGGSFGSIFANAVLRPNVSSSLGDFGIAKSSTFKTNSGSLDAGCVLKVIASTVAFNQSNLNVSIFYAPSASYGG